MNHFLYVKYTPGGVVEVVQTKRTTNNVVVKREELFILCIIFSNVVPFL